MNTLILIFKGFFIGIGKIIPGVSGSLIAITLGVYDKLLNVASNIFKDLKENIKFIIPIGIGLLLSVVSTSRLISYLLSNYYVVTMLFFIGLIIGGVPSTIRKIKYKSNINILYAVISFLFVLSIYFIKTSNPNTIKDYPFYIMFLIGILDAATMIIPGISGTAIMMILGCYNTVLNMFSNAFNIDNLTNIVPFFIGVVVGIIMISKIISYFFKKYNEQTNYCIIGFICSSCLLLIIQILEFDINFVNVLIGIILMILGFIISYNMEKK